MLYIDTGFLFKEDLRACPAKVKKAEQVAEADPLQYKECERIGKCGDAKKGEGKP